MKIVKGSRLIIASLLVIAVQHVSFAQDIQSGVVVPTNVSDTEKQDAVANVVNNAKKAIDSARQHLLTNGTTSADDKKNVKIIIEQVSIAVQAQQQLNKLNLIGEGNTDKSSSQEGYWSRFVTATKKLGIGILAPFKAGYRNTQKEKENAPEIIAALVAQQAEITQMYTDRSATKKIVTPEQTQLKNRYEAIIAQINNAIYKQQLITGDVTSAQKKLLVGTAVAAGTAAGLAFAKMYLDVNSEVTSQQEQAPTAVTENVTNEESKDLLLKESTPTEIITPSSEEVVSGIETPETALVPFIGSENQENDSVNLSNEESGNTESGNLPLEESTPTEIITPGFEEVAPGIETSETPLTPLITPENQENDSVNVANEEPQGLLSEELAPTEIITSGSEEVASGIEMLETPLEPSLDQEENQQEDSIEELSAKQVRLAEQARIDDENAKETALLAEEKAKEEARLADEARLAKEKAQEEALIAEERRLAAEKEANEAEKLAELTRIDEEKAKEAARILEEEENNEVQRAEEARLTKKKAEQEALIAEERRLEADQKVMLIEEAKRADEQAKETERLAKLARANEEKAKKDEQEAQENLALAKETAQKEEILVAQAKNAEEEAQEEMQEAEENLILAKETTQKEEMLVAQAKIAEEEAKEEKQIATKEAQIAEEDRIAAEEEAKEKMQIAQEAKEMFIQIDNPTESIVQEDIQEETSEQLDQENSMITNVGTTIQDSIQPVLDNKLIERDKLQEKAVQAYVEKETASRLLNEARSQENSIEEDLEQLNNMVQKATEEYLAAQGELEEFEKTHRGI